MLFVYINEATEISQNIPLKMKINYHSFSIISKLANLIKLDFLYITCIFSAHFDLEEINREFY